MGNDHFVKSKTMKPALCVSALLAVLSIIPVQAQDRVPSAAPVAIASPVSNSDAHEANTRAFEAAAKALETQAKAYEALELSIIAWEAVGINEMARALTRQQARELASDMRELALNMRASALRAQTPNMAPEQKSGIASMLVKLSPEGESLVRAQKVASSMWEFVSAAKGAAMRAEGNMIKAQANVTGRYAPLWERAAGESATVRTLFTRAELETRIAAEAFDKVAKMYWAGIAHEKAQK